MRQYQSATVTVFCRGCGAPRVLTRRQSRRAGLCSACLYSPKRMSVTDRHRAWWFKRFTDTELAVLASEFAEKVVPPTRIAERRQALVASGALHEGVPSGGAHSVLLSPPGEARTARPS